MTTGEPLDADVLRRIVLQQMYAPTTVTTGVAIDVVTEQDDASVVVWGRLTTGPKAGQHFNFTLEMRDFSWDD